ncbi:putative transporter [Candidatus Ornithobacterium hominis]|uniref:Putative transporter n=1 Tax=Candidatus Ornithobacterium hominis TaxID=2497989 RepID=A0A383TWK4_9FLAO|nr:putative transporter [Candidatus Ornithobacterium hominis]MCT7903830.1 putative transporter [Candidatus Ornithobacterium hominis]SZD71173.1 putative transporter [Candidatus Ornithobacterium hominis]SZD71849.1 putative transporter [Candidatus Ornithobacterium hominis]
MFDWLTSLLFPVENPSIGQSLITIMLAIGTGVFLGRLKFGKITFGISAVMFTGLFLGHLGYRIEESILDFIRDFGLILFVYGIGIQVGPSFFSSFKSEGLKFNILAVSTVFLSGIITFILYLTTGLSIENMVGIMSGSVTNTPGLGAAKNTIAELKDSFPGRTFDDPAIGYAITYPLGVFGIIGSIILVKVLLKIETVKEMRLFRMSKINCENPLIPRKMRVTNEAYLGKSIEDLQKEFGEGIIVSRIKRSGQKEVVAPMLETKLSLRDVLMLEGKEEDLSNFIQKVGRLSSDSFIESDSEIVDKKIYVTNPKAVHKKLSQLDLYNTYDLKITRVFRAGREILPRPSLELYYGDVLKVIGKEDAINEAGKIIGNQEKKLVEPDFLSLFGGLFLGIVLGSIPIAIPSLPVPLKLGFAAGPLIVALLISRYGGIKFIHSYINNGAIHFMKDLGIALFFAAVGVHAGDGFYDNFIAFNGWTFLLYGSAITLIPLFTMVIVGRFFLKINFLQLAGIMSGAYTDPAALSFSTNYLDSDIPIQSYAQIYPLVTIARIVTASMLVLLFA